MSGAYNGRYKRDLAQLKRAGGTSCWRCGRWLERHQITGDHVPPLSQHDHLPGTGCCALEAACARCNYRDGGRIGARRSAQVRRRQARLRRLGATDPSRVW